MTKIFIVIIISLLFAAQTIAGDLIEIERVKELGGGLRIEDHAEVSNSTFESIAHYRYLFYKDKKLGHCGYFEFSSSKRYALYQEGISGELFVFDTKSKKNKKISNGFDGLVKKIKWSDDESKVHVQFYDGKPDKAYTIKRIRRSFQTGQSNG
jgi:hypothetical protein